MVERQRQRRCVPLGAIHVGLNFAQSNWPLGQAAVLVEDGVVRILPTLIDQTLGVLALIFHKPVAVRVAINVDPMKGRLDIRPQLPNRFEISGAFEVFADQEHEQRRRVDAAVITRERHKRRRNTICGRGEKKIARRRRRVGRRQVSGLCFKDNLAGRNPVFLCM